MASDWDESPGPKNSDSDKTFNLRATKAGEGEEKLRITREREKRQIEPNTPALQEPQSLSSAINANDFLPRALQGSVNDNKSLPPVPPELLPGRRFDPSLLPPLGTEDGWYWIPTWAAGISHRDFIVTLDQPVQIGLRRFSVNRPTEDHVTSPEPSGWQMDRVAGIWDYYHVPWLEHHEGTDFLEYKFVYFYEPLKVTNSEIFVRYRARTIGTFANLGEN